jgi:hypothetical protein
MNIFSRSHFEFISYKITNISILFLFKSNYKYNKMNDKDREELKKRLRARIEEGKISRSSKSAKQDILDKTLKNMGIDKEKLEKDMEEVKKQGGLTINLNK